LIESAVLDRLGGDVGAADVVAEEGPNGLQRRGAGADRASIFVFVLIVLFDQETVYFFFVALSLFLVSALGRMAAAACRFGVGKPERCVWKVDRSTSLKAVVATVSLAVCIHWLSKSFIGD
jgi:hypothetical protein